MELAVKRYYYFCKKAVAWATVCGQIVEALITAFGEVKRLPERLESRFTGGQ